MYYDAVKILSGYKGRVYTYDSSGNSIVEVWLSKETYNTASEAEDAVCEYAEDNNIEVELG